MKFKNILLYAALLSGMSFSSCTDFLDEDSNPNALSPGIFWKSEGDIMKGLTSVYGALQPNASWAIPFERYIVIDGYRSDEITHRDDVTSWMNISSFNVEPTNSVVKTEWTNLYKGINYANQCLTNIPTVPGDSESLNALKKQSIADIHSTNANDPLKYSWLVSDLITVNSCSPDQGTKVKDITQRLDKYTYTYNQIGIYNVTFLARNANIDHSSTTTYHMVVNVVE